MKMLPLCALLFVLAVGCKTTDSSDGGVVLSYNMTQSVSRSAGDVAMTALLEEDVVSPEKARLYVEDVASFLETGSINKTTLNATVFGLAQKYGLTGMSDYIDSLISIVPSDLGMNETIP